MPDPAIDVTRLMAERPVVDLHADTFYRLARFADVAKFGARTQEGHIDLPRLVEGGVGLVVQAIYTPKEKTGPEGTDHAMRLAARILEAVRTNPGVGLVEEADDLDRFRGPDSIGFLLHLESVSPFAGEMGFLSLFEKLGVRSVGLTHNHANEAAGGCEDGPDGLGLSGFGRELVSELDRRGILLDVAHLGNRATRELLERARGPVVASHTGFRALCDRPRNLSDETIGEIVRTGGLVGIDFVPGHLVREGPATMDVVLAHIAHVAERFGTDHVAIGSDFDGFESAPPVGLEDASRFPALAARLLAAGYSEADTRKILGGNARRVLGEVLARRARR